MNEDTLSPEEFKAIQLGWVAALSQPELYDVMKELAKPENANMRVRTDLSSMATKNGLTLPRNTKISSDLDPAGNPVGTICYSWDPENIAKHPYHCLTIKNPFVIT
ncbi:MAG: hypothetical protein ABJD97_04055 [Betaproteobacteria bacterium]